MQGEKTMTISKFDVNACRSVGEEIEAAVQAVAAKHGIKIKIGKATYTNGPTMDIRLECAVIAADGVVIDKDAASLDQLGELLGLVPQARGKVFPYARKSYTLVGYRNT